MTPNEWLIKYGRMYPNAWKQAALFRTDKAKKELGDWPRWCYLPLSAWYAIVSHTRNEDRLTDLEIVGDVARLAALGAWRYTQGIYRFDPDIYAALIDTPIGTELPLDVVLRLPEWCLYVETPGFQAGASVYDGFFAHLEYDVNTGRTELRVILVNEDILLPQVIHIGNWSIIGSISRMYAEASKQYDAHPNITISDENYQRYEINMADLQLMWVKVLSLLVYLCSEEPEIDNERIPLSRPHIPAETRIKGGIKLFPPDKPIIWGVGKKTGETLRKMQAEYEEAGRTGRTVRPHIRRAHWHGYWRGERKSENRTFIYKWLPPIIVIGKEE